MNESYTKRNENSTRSVYYPESQKRYNEKIKNIILGVLEEKEMCYNVTDNGIE